MKRLLKIFCAHIKCEFYIGFLGMWSGECKMTGYENNKTVLIAAVKHDIYYHLLGRPESQKNTKLNKIFYDDRKNCLT